MKVLSLFDGISCGRVALERAGIPVSRYVAYEIDKNAINCSAWNWPDIEHRGSVVGADFTEFAGFDLVMGGFPCQDLSIAGNRAGLEGTRSGLFWELVRAIDEVRPRYFFVENNVGMPKDAQWIISATLGVEPIPIDSALVSAQTRKRLYWTNIPGIDQPKDRGVLLSSILKDRATDYYYLSDRNIAYIKRKTYGSIQYELNSPPPEKLVYLCYVAQKELSSGSNNARRTLARNYPRRMRTAARPARRLYRYDPTATTLRSPGERLAGGYNNTLF